MAAADDSVNNYKAVNRLVHERARKSAISHGESQPTIAPSIFHGVPRTCKQEVKRLFDYFINPPKTTLNGMCIMNATPDLRGESRNRAAKLKCGS